MIVLLVVNLHTSPENLFWTARTVKNGTGFPMENCYTSLENFCWTTTAVKKNGPGPLRHFFNHIFTDPFLEMNNLMKNCLCTSRKPVPDSKISEGWT